jgi:hypothetical protein
LSVLNGAHSVHASRGCASGASAVKQRKEKLKAEADDSDGGGESCCTPEDTHADVLGDAGMILRDPPVLHLLLHETVCTTWLG